jgi:multidrug efflux pump subunit AcrA (membrane-fusion protein)
VILSAYPGKELPAQIIQLPYPYGRGGGANMEEADKLTHISFDPEDLDIGPGDLVKVIVVLEEKIDALWLPPAAIRTFAGRKFVVVEEEGRQRRVDITVGIESAERVEITDGLQEGEVVIGQ